MALQVEKLEDGLLVVRVSGVLGLAELQTQQEQAELAIGRFGKIRILILLDHFQGWEHGKDWGDMSFLLAHDDDIEAIAVVGEEAWREQVLMFLAAGMRVADVGYFTPDRADLARRMVG